MASLYHDISLLWHLFRLASYDTTISLFSLFLLVNTVGVVIIFKPLKGFFMLPYPFKSPFICIFAFLLNPLEI